MSEPKRWLDDPNAPAELRELLQRAPRGRALDGATRARLGSRVARYAAIPLSAAAWLSVKSAAALGVAAGVATASVVAVVERTVFAPEPPLAATTQPKPPSAPRRVAERPAPPSAPPPASAEGAPVAALAEPPAAARAPAPSATWPAERGLAEETALLEKARRALATAPASALELTREHTLRFPKPELRAERNLIEIEALYRVGRRDQARSLAERLLAGNADDLYAERVRRLLGKIERGE